MVCFLISFVFLLQKVCCLISVFMLQKHLLSHLSLSASERSALSSQSFCFRKVLSSQLSFQIRKVYPPSSHLSSCFRKVFCLISVVCPLQKGLLSQSKCLSTSENSAFRFYLPFHFRNSAFTSGGYLSTSRWSALSSHLSFCFVFLLQESPLSHLSCLSSGKCSLISVVFLLQKGLFSHLSCIISTTESSAVSSQLSIDFREFDSVSSLSTSESFALLLLSYLSFCFRKVCSLISVVFLLLKYLFSHLSLLSVSEWSALSSQSCFST